MRSLLLYNKGIAVCFNSPFQFVGRYSVILTLVLAVSAPTAQAGLIDTDTNTLDNLILGDTLESGGFEFSGFEVLARSASGGALAPEDEHIQVTAGVDNLTGHPGLAFGLAMNAGPGQTVNVTLGYHLTAPLGLDIEAVSLSIFGSTAGGTGLVVVSQSVLDQPGFGATSLANLGAWNLDGTQFDMLTNSMPVEPPTTSVYVLTDISVTGGASGIGHLSFFEQHYVPIPEPASVWLGLSGFAGVALLLLRRRRR